MNVTGQNEWQRTRQVFEEALLQPKEGRSQYAYQLCGDNETLWNEVRSLLDWHESSESFLETPAFIQIVEEGQLPDQLVAGQRLLHYEIRKLIGKGGMGEVYLAHDTRLDRNVAVKILRTDLSPNVRGSERLLREARAAALLEHPNICHIHEISEADGFNFIVMQYVVGTTLDEILTRGGINVDTALDLGAQIAGGLAEAHSLGIIHRDIKPANIIISEKKLAKILDFGLAKFIEAESRVDAASRMESTGGVMGTVPYMSPEQLSGRTVDARTDVFSFGSLLFEMLSGTSPFRRERNEDTISAILTEEPDWSVISPVLRPLLERCLAKAQENRYASAGNVAEALVAARKQERAERSTRLQPTNAKRKAVSTDQSEVKTASYAMAVTQSSDFKPTDEILKSDSSLSGDQNWDSENGPNRLSKGKFRTRDRYLFRDLSTILIGALGLIVISAGVFGYYQYSTSYPINKENVNSTNAPRRLYWELGYTVKRNFIQNRVTQIQTLIGDDQRAINDESLDGIFKEVDWYVSRRDSLSQEPFKEGLRSVYGRASQYVPLVSTEFEKKKVPTAIGIYQAIVESEYRDCLVSDTGPVGIFQFTKATAEKYGLASQERCKVDLSSKAAAAYISDLLSHFGGEHSSWTLAILSFNQGEDSTRSQIEKLRELGLNERNYWAISENRERFSYYNPDSDRYIRRFFAAAIIGENPEMFGLVTPPLSTIRQRTDLGVPAQDNLVTIPGGTFSMGRNDSVLDLEKPAHPESVNGFIMNKTEVTNIEFAEFISATGYKPAGPKTNFLTHWLNGRPLKSEETYPVRFVNLDDVSAFIKWKSQNYGIQYRLPTEQEWEYAARNGSKNNLYPWGDKFDARCAFIDQQSDAPVAVGSHSCPNIWGVQDLIGNVSEWTSTTASPYRGTAGEIIPDSEPKYMVRGGSAYQKSKGPNAITSTFRIPVAGSQRSAEVGFRLVTSR